MDYFFHNLPIGLLKRRGYYGLFFPSKEEPNRLMPDGLRSRELNASHEMPLLRTRGNQCAGLAGRRRLRDHAAAARVRKMQETLHHLRARGNGAPAGAQEG